jgi:hypothetical protein
MHFVLVIFSYRYHVADEYRFYIVLYYTGYQNPPDEWGTDISIATITVNAVGLTLLAIVSFVLIAFSYNLRVRRRVPLDSP